VVAIAGLLALPFLAGEGEKSWHRRPIAVLSLVTIAVLWGVFTNLATYTPWSPKMHAWSSDTIPEKYLHNLSPVERQGAIIFQAMQCRNCHSLGGQGGQRGPALDTVATRLTEDQLIRQVIQGGGNMPAYGKNLSPPQVTALVRFLDTLHPSGQPAAADASNESIGSPPPTRGSTGGDSTVTASHPGVK
jgi:ubiquinol-cytochrome c reductase cytochrome b subunit